MGRAWVSAVGGAVAALWAWPLFAFAASSVGMTVVGPSGQPVEVGERFGIVIQIGESDAAIDTVRADIQYDTQFLEVEDVSLLGPWWNKSPGSAVDTKNGMVSLGAYRRGAVPNPTPFDFGMIVFSAKKAGTTSVLLLSDSKLLQDGDDLGNPAQFIPFKDLLIIETTSQTTPKLTVACDTHPSEDVWYAVQQATCNWSPTTESVLVGLTQNPTNIPAESRSGEPASWLSTIADGAWYFQIAEEREDGTIGPVTSRRLRVDTTPPNPFEPHIDRARWLEGETVLVTFGTTDQTSGVEKYEISLNDGPYQEKTSPFAIADVSVGDLLIEVRATDGAGNTRYGKTGLRVYPEGTDLSELEAQEEKALVEANDSGWGLVIVCSLIIVIAGILYAISRRRK